MIFFLALIVSCATAIAAEPAHNVVHQPASADVHSVLVDANAALQGSIDRTLASVQHLLQLVAAEKVVSKDQRIAAQRWLYEVAERLNALANRDHGEITIASLALRAQTLRSIISAVRVELDCSFAHCIPLPDVDVPHRGQMHDYDDESVLMYVGQVSQESEMLSASMITAGLTWYNRVYTGIDGVNQRYHITSTAFEAARIGAVGLGLAWMCMVFYKALPEDLKRSLHIGSPDWDATTNKYVNMEQLRHVHQNVTLARDTLDVAKLAAGVTAGWSLWPKVKKQLRKVDAFMRGESNDSIGLSVRSNSPVTLDDPHFDHIRPSLKRLYDILKFVENPALFINSGNRPPKAILFTGGPGDGKSYAALGLLGSVNKQNILLGRNKFVFIPLTPTDFMGWGGEAVRELKRFAQENAPCIIFIDEFHLCNLQPAGNSALLAEFLTFLDELDKENDPNKLVIVLAATNRPELLDKALVRQGRFGETIHFDSPTLNERFLMFEAFCKKSGVDSESIDLKRIARITDGASRSALSKIFETAAFTAKAENRGISFEHLYSAVNTIVRRHRPEQRLSAAESETVAAYQAGVALVNVLCANAPELESVTIEGFLPSVTEQYDWMAKMRANSEKKKERNPNKLRYGRIYSYRASETIKPSFAEKRAVITVLVAGSIAHQILRGDMPSYRGKDRRRAYDLALEIVLEGLPLNALSKQEQNARREKAHKLLDECMNDARKLIEAHRDALNRLSVELRTKGSLRAERVSQIIRN